MTRTSASTPRSMTRAWLIVVLVPVLVAATTALVLRSWRGQLPDPVATHWGSGSTPDGFTSLADLPWLGLLALIALPAGCLPLALGGRQGFNRRFAAGFAAGMAVFLGLVVLLSVNAQRGLTDAASAAGDIDGSVALSVLAAVAAGALAAWLVPGSTADAAAALEPIPPDAPRVALAPGERAAWSKRTRSSRIAYALLGGVLALFIAMAIVSGLWLTFAAMGILLAVALATTLVFRVSVGEDGLVVRGLFGVPRFQTPLSDVAVAQTVSVDPMGEFGGWGFRIGLDGRSGVVVRKGEAIEVTRGDGQRFVVTVDDAARGAALLNTLADRHRTAASR
ncbi:DUF1648 domain-containing protein [Nostocoides australiense]